MRTIVFQGNCDRAAVAAALPDLVEAVHAGPLLIDASGVTRGGQPLLQLMLSARATSSRVAFKLSDAMRDIVRLAGLSDILVEGDAA